MVKTSLTDVQINAKPFFQLDMLNFPKRSFHEKKNIKKCNVLYLQPDFRIVFTHTRLSIRKLDLLRSSSLEIFITSL